MTVLLIGKGEASRPPTLLYRNACRSLPASSWDAGDTLGPGRRQSQILQLLSLWKHLELLAREDAVVEDPEIHAGAKFSSLVSTMHVSPGAKFTHPGLGHL